VGLDGRRAWIVLVASTALSAVSARGGPAGRESERAILALEKVWLDGYLARDASVFERLLDDDLSQVGLAGESAGKTVFLDFFRNGDWEYLAGGLEDLRVRVVGDEAIATGRLNRTVRVGSRVTQGSVAFTHVWARRRSAWRVIHLHVTPVPQSTSETRTLSGIRVLYRLRVKAEHEERFQDAWKRVTEAALRRAPGARGSLLARTRETSDVFLAVARWESHEQWRAYRQGPALDAAAVADLNGTSELISHEVIDEVADIGRP
jgi:heme-degrading monooxygenase HmoA/ketosteroid isomerase-like protein